MNTEEFNALYKGDIPDEILTKWVDVVADKMVAAGFVLDDGCITHEGTIAAHVLLVNMAAGLMEEDMITGIVLRGAVDIISSMARVSVIALENNLTVDDLVALKS